MRKRNLGIIAALLLILVAGFAAYIAGGSARNQPMPPVEAALISDAQVTVEMGEWLVFGPTAVSPRSGLILYPGGLVPAAAYAPTARAIAAAGYLVILTPMPLNLAVTAPDTAQAVIQAYPGIGQWAIGGHSLGGAMAARFAAQNPDHVSGVVLWASYPAAADDLSNNDLNVVSISADRDGLATPADINAARDLLPANTRYVVIAGGNHSQFGWYGNGPQRGDNPATIDREAQQAQILEATISLLEQLDSGK